MLDLKRLRVLRAVAEHGSFSAAADELYVSQSAVSQQIANLEAEVGEPLVLRLRSGPVLTDAARAANFTNEGGVDGRVRFLTNVMGLWLLSETIRGWERAGETAALETRLAEQPSDSHWELLAKSALRDELLAAREELTRRVLGPAGAGEEDGAAPMERWLAAEGHRVDRFEQVLSEMETEVEFDIAMLTVAAQELRAHA